MQVFSLNTWQGRDITQEAKDAIARDEEEARAEKEALEVKEAKEAQEAQRAQEASDENIRLVCRDED